MRKCYQTFYQKLCSTATDIQQLQKSLVSAAARTANCCRCVSTTRPLLQNSRFPKTEPLHEVTTVDSEEALADAVRPHFDQQQPLVVRNALSISNKNTNTMKNLQDWNYLEELVDFHTDCHIEIGGNYSKSQIADVPFVEFPSFMKFFEERYGKRLEGNNEPDPPQELIYLAQNDIFPELLEIIDIPSLCNNLGEGKLYSTMIWIGPYGCISPLHFDPLDNILMQFVGEKKVFLCPYNAQVYAGSDGNQPNTSPLDPEADMSNDIVQMYPSIQDITFGVATLKAGDALYIPKKWYHYVRTVETSVSINTWFR